MSNSFIKVLPTQIISSVSGHENIEDVNKTADKDKIIYSCAGVGSFVIALILIFFFYFLLKRRLNGRNITAEDNQSSAVRREFNIDTTDVFISNRDSIHYEISIKLLTPWSEMYSKHDSDEFHSLKSLVEASIADLYVNYEAFKNASLVCFREGSVIAEIELIFTSIAKHPLIIIKEAVCFGRFSNLEVDKNFFLENKVNTSSESLFNSKFLTIDGDNSGFKSSSSQSSLHDHIESGYGSQIFDASTHLSPKKHKVMQSYSGESLKSNHSAKSSLSLNNPVQNTTLQKEDKTINLRDTLKSLNKIVKKRNSEKSAPKTGLPHVGLFNFLPQDDRELAFKQGEVIFVDYVDDGGWAKATNQNGLKGWIPQNFVVPIDVEQYEHTKKAVESILYLDSVIDSINSPVDIETPTQLVEEHNKLSEDQTKFVESSESVAPPRSSLFITIFPFEPCEQKELKLEVGDLVDVLKTSETGWWKGRCLRSQCDGWFPSSYVQPQPSFLSVSNLIKQETGDDRGTVSDSEIHLIDAISLKKKYDDTTGYNSDNGGCSTKIERLNVNPDNFSAQVENSDLGNLTLTSAQKELPLVDGYLFKTEPPSKPVPPKPRKRHIQDQFQLMASLKEADSKSNQNLQSLENKDEKEFQNHDTSHKGNINQSIDKQLFPRTDEKRLLSPINKLRPRSFQDTPQSNFIQLSNRLANNNMKPAWSLPSLNVGDQVKLSPDDDRPFLEPIPRRTKRHSLPSVDSPIVSQGIASDESSNKSLKEGASSDDESQSQTESKTFKTSSPMRFHDHSQIDLGLRKDDNSFSKNKHSTVSSEKREELVYRKVASKKPELDQNLSACIPPEDTDKDYIPRISNRKIDSSRHSRARTANKHFSSFKHTIIEESENLSPDEDTKKRSIYYKNRDNNVKNLTNLKSNETESNSQNASEPLESVKNSIKLDDKILTETGNQINSNNSTSQNFKSKRSSSMQSLSSITSIRSNSSAKLEHMNVRRAIVNVVAQSEYELSFSVGAILYELRPRNKEGLSFGILENSSQGWYPSDAVEPYYIF